MKNILFLRKMKFAFGSAVLILLVLGAVLALCDAVATRRMSQTKVLLLSGSILAVLIVANAAWSVQRGRVLRWFGLDTDTTASEESGAKYRGLLKAAPDAMVVVNQSGGIPSNIGNMKRMPFSLPRHIVRGG